MLTSECNIFIARKFTALNYLITQLFGPIVNLFEAWISTKRSARINIILASNWLTNVSVWGLWGTLTVEDVLSNPI
jgi:hypothetical protein